MSIRKVLKDEHGIALIVVMLLVLALSAVALTTAAVMMNSGMVQRSADRSTTVDGGAIAGLEEARSRLNGDAALYPEAGGYVTLENAVAVKDASGATIPGLKRWTYAGPEGIASGQYGINGAVISVVEDNAKVRTVRRLDINQESFARYAYFTDVEPSNISFGNVDVINGPVHTNDDLKIYAPSGNDKAWFRGTVTTAQSVLYPSYGRFDQGYTENAAYIAMPKIADLTKLQAQATAGKTSFAGNTNGGYGEATLRIEFIGVDLNGDGDTRDADEGFIRLYRSTDAAYVVAARPSSMASSRNCVDYNSSTSTSGNHVGTTWRAMADHNTSGTHKQSDALIHASMRCFLGGAPELQPSAPLNAPFKPTDSKGAWIAWTGGVSPKVKVLNRPDSLYLHPISDALNPNFKGVIYVEGKVAISGTVRGKVTLVTPNSIIIADDVVQATSPANSNCDDILGLLAGQDIIVADNSINAPVPTGGSPNYRSRDGTADPSGAGDEFIHAIVLALNIFTVENYDDGPTNAETCDGEEWGRGCLYLTGGLIQRTRGAVGTTGGTGSLKRYDYNECALTDPPPYFPTTGHFVKNRVYPIDPVGFDIATWFATYQKQ